MLVHINEKFVMHGNINL